MTDLNTELKARADAFQQALRAEGFTANEAVWDEQSRTWDVTVKINGATLLLMLDADDPDFVRFLLPNFHDVDASELPNALMAADMANKRCKGAKVHLNSRRTDTIASVEWLDDRSVPVNPGQVKRYLGMLLFAVKVFGENVRQPQAA